MRTVRGFGAVALLLFATVVDPAARPAPVVRVDAAADAKRPQNRPPVPLIAQIRGPVFVGAAVTFDGSASTDPEGAPLFYEWQLAAKPAASQAHIRSTAPTTSMMPDVAGNYIIRLTVTDGRFSNSTTLTVTTTNRPPRAIASVPPTPRVSEIVDLDGSGSTDPDGDRLSYSWTLTSKPRGSLATVRSSSALGHATFTADRAGHYVATITVSDGLLTDIRTVAVDTMNSPPVANAGPARTVQPGTIVMLDGSGSFDLDANPLTFFWTVTEQPSASALVLSDPFAVRPQAVIDRPGRYGFQLRVRDDSGTESSPATVVISTDNSAPVADAGPDRTIHGDTSVRLDATGSTDADGNPLTFAWRIVSSTPGPAPTLSGATGPSATFSAGAGGEYAVSVTVSDPSGASSVDVVRISAVNTPPVASAGPDQTVPAGTLVSVDAGGSTDVDGDEIAYAWSFLSKPTGSVAKLSDDRLVRPAFRADLPGEYVLQVIVTDPHGRYGVDSLVVSTFRSGPTANAGRDRPATTGERVVLDGGVSADPDGDALSVLWALTSRPAGSAATILNPSSFQPVLELDAPGLYVAQLIASDGLFITRPDSVVITTMETPPAADAGSDLVVPPGGPAIRLDGHGSKADDGRRLAARWALLSRPDGSAARLGNATQLDASLMPDAPGWYVAQLIVNDGHEDSTPDTVVVHVVTAAEGVAEREAATGDAPPFGIWDTPGANINAAGQVAVTGWALDDVGIAAVDLYRNPVAGEPVQPNGLVFIGTATFVPGARPDVAGLFPSMPANDRAGWGLMVLTNMLPGQGNGVFDFTVVARDTAGQLTTLGTRRLTIDNAHSTKPFGTIDTPAQGAIVSGTLVNFGWALTPVPNMIAIDGSTIDVYLDGQIVGHPTYNNFRPDVATLFPGLANTNGAIGFFVIDTTLLVNGLHSIAWLARDNAGNNEGLGSRFFTVLNLPSATLGPTPFTVERAGKTTATLTLSAAAPSAGLTVALRSDNTGLATVPPSVVIAAGQSTATFDVSGVAEGTTTIRASGTVQPAALSITIVPPSAAVIESSPASGEGSVAVTRETIFRFSRALASTSAITPQTLYAEFAGQKLQSRINISPDRRTVTLFYLQTLPASARVRVHFVTDGLVDELGVPIDGDRDGKAGGAQVVDFDTLTLTTLPGTIVTGRVFASELGDGGINTPLAGVVISVDGLETTLRTTTDALGNFALNPAPVGEFFVHIDGRTATNTVPVGAYYPTVGKKWESRARASTSIGDVFLPLIAPGTLAPVSATAPTAITFPGSVLAQHPELAGVQITVPADSLFSDNGARGGMVGISPVSPDRLPSPLPPGLQFPLVITVQTDGATNFDRPVPSCFPNLPDPTTKVKLAAGAKSALWSFNHDIGDWEIVGPMTVSADGVHVCTDAGVGIRQPGWHGTDPDVDIKFPKDITQCSQLAGLNAANSPRISAVGATGPPVCYQRPPDVDECNRPLPGGGRRKDDTVEFRDLSEELKRRLPSIQNIFRDVLLDPTYLLVFTSARDGHDKKPGSLHNFGAAVDVRNWGITCGQQEEIAKRVRALFPDTEVGGSCDGQKLPSANFPEATPHLHFGCLLCRDKETSPPSQCPVPVMAGERQLQVAAPSDFRFERAYVLITEVPGTRVRFRGRMSSTGTFPTVSLRPSRFYLLELFDPEHSLVLTREFITPSAGNTVDPVYQSPREFKAFSEFVLAGTLEVEVAPSVRGALPEIDRPVRDTDSDGLADVAEQIVGTSPTAVDTDGDGISDFAEIQNGSNPLDNLPATTGINKTVATPGTAFDVAARNDVAAIAMGSAGVAIVNVSSALNPVIVSVVDTPGDARSVAFEATLVAVADGPGGLAVVDIADPPAARIVYQLPAASLGGDGRVVAVAGGTAYVGLGSGEVVAIDLETGAELGRATVSAAVYDLAISRDSLFVLAGLTLHAFSLTDGLTQQVGWVPVSGLGPEGITGRRRLFAGATVAYVTSYPGFDTIDISIPSAMTAIAGAVDQGPNSYKQIVTNGSGLGVVALGVNPRDDGTHDVSLYDVSDPTKANRQFLTTFATPGITHSVSLYNGLVFAADGSAGLQVVNYLAADVNGVKPAISLQSNFSITGAAGVAEEGKIMRLTAIATDDVQVRNVEFFVDGVSVAKDGNYPFEHRFITPLLAARPSFTVRACAFDTGGNSQCTADVTISLVQDATAPAIRAVVPKANGSAPLNTLTAVSATFSEPVQPALISASTFKVFGGGPDGVAGTADDIQIVGTVEYRDQHNIALMTFASALPIGEYRAVLSGGIADLAGNPLGADFTWTFRIKGLKAWVKDASGFWDDPLNWSEGTIPEAGDIVIIDRPAGSFTVTIRTTTPAITSLRSAENVIVSGVLNSAGALRFEGGLQLTGTIQGAGSAVIAGGGSTWTSGVIALAGGLVVAEAQTLTISSGNGHYVVNSLLTNNGTVTWTGGAVFYQGNSTITNAAGALWDVQGDLVISANGGGTQTLVNAGTFRRSSGGGLAYVESGTIANTGTWEIQTGTFQTQVAMTTSGLLKVSAGATMSLANVTLQAGSTFAGAGTLTMPGTTTVTGDVTITTQTVLNGTVTGTGKLTLGVGGTWTSGVIGLAGGFIVGAGQTLTISSGNGHYVVNSLLTNNGTVVWTGGAVFYQGNSTITNAAGALWDVQGDLVISANGGGTQTLVNAGTFRRSSGSGLAYVESGTIANTGTWDVQTGTFQTQVPMTTSGQLKVSAGATMSLANVTLQAGSTFAGAGTLTMPGTTTIDGDVTMTTQTVLNGTVTGTGKLTLGAGGTWTSGVIGLAGGFVVGAGQTLTISSGNGHYISNGALVNNGTVTWTAGAVFYQGNSTITNAGGALWDVQGDLVISANGGGAQTFVNAGTFRRSSGGGLAYVESGTITNTGTWEIQTGTFQTQVAMTTSGLLKVSAGATMSLANVTLQAGSTFAGAGTLTMPGTTTVTGDLTVALPIVLNGTVTGTGKLTLGVGGTWTSGVISLTSGLVVGTGQTLTISSGNGHYITNGALVNNGTVVWTGGAVFYQGNSTITNATGALWDVQGDLVISANGGGTQTFVNAGTFRKSSGSGLAYVESGTIANTGTWEIQTGTFQTQVAMTTSGLLKVSAGATMSLANVTLQAGSTFAGAGTLTMPGTTTVTGDVTMTSPMSLTGTVTGSGKLTLGAAGTWTSGVINLAGGLVVSAGETLMITSGNGHYLVNSALLNNGTVTWTAGPVFFQGDSTITNAAAGIWDWQANLEFGQNGGGAQVVTNAGIFRNSSSVRSTLTLSGTVAFSNSGTIELRAGAVAEYDRIVANTVTLGSTLATIFVGGFTPVSGFSMSAVSYQSRTGTFASITDQGHGLTASYGANTLTLSKP